MAYELREGEGYIFKNSSRSGNQPAARGSCLINGKEHEIAVWPQKEGKKGSYFKIKPVLPPDVEAAVAAAPAFNPSQEEIPF